jgi:hypothetical protein
LYDKTLWGSVRRIPDTPGEDGWASDVSGLLDDFVDHAEATSFLGGDGSVLEYWQAAASVNTLAAGATLTPGNRVHRLQGDGGPVTLSAVTAIADGEKDGQILTLLGGHASDTVEILDGASVTLGGGSAITLTLGEALHLRWDDDSGSWFEIGRSSLTTAFEVPVEFGDAIRLLDQNALELYEDEANGTNKISILAPASLASDYSLTLPEADGSEGQVLQSDGAGALLFAEAPGKALEYFRHAGGASIEAWYPVGENGSFFNTALSASTLGDDLLAVMPFATLRGGTIDRIRIFVDTAGGVSSKARVGLYEATSDANLYPSALVADFGEIDTSGTGFLTLNVNQVLEPAKLYWFAILLTGGGGTVPVLGGPSSLDNSIFGAAGASRSEAGRYWVTAVHSYSALPGPFPTGASILGSGIPPRILIRYSA